MIATPDPHSHQTLKIYILDERSAAPLPDLVKVTISVRRDLAGSAVADWNEIIREIQKTASAIRGKYPSLKGFWLCVYV